MPQVKREVYLKCKPEEAFNKIAKAEFLQKVNAKAGVLTKVIYQNERIIRYSLQVEHVGTWESERVLIKESNLILTQRRTPLAPFNYMVVIYKFVECNEGTKLIYIEDFTVQDKNIELESKILGKITGKVDSILKNISDSFN